MSTAPEQIILFDLPSRPPSRFLLNYKGLDYRTEWMEYPEIRAKLENGVAPNQQGAAYTSPTVRLPDGTFVMESKRIAQEIEHTYPEPPIYLDSPILAKLEPAIRGMLMSVRGILAPCVNDRLLNQVSKEYYSSVIIPRVNALQDSSGITEEEVGWEGAKPYLKEVTKMLTENPSGPYFMGTTVSYADLVWGGILVFLQRLGSDQYEHLLQAASDSQPHIELMKGLEKWYARQD